MLRRQRIDVGHGGFEVGERLLNAVFSTRRRDSLMRAPIVWSVAPWATLNRAVSRLFPMPKGGRIAVTVISHLGDEVMKVFRVE